MTPDDWLSGPGETPSPVKTSDSPNPSLDGRRRRVRMHMSINLKPNMCTKSMPKNRLSGERTDPGSARSGICLFRQPFSTDHLYFAGNFVQNTQTISKTRFKRGSCLTTFRQAFRHTSGISGSDRSGTRLLRPEKESVPTDYCRSREALPLPLPPAIISSGSRYRPRA